MYCILVVVVIVRRVEAMIGLCRRIGNCRSWVVMRRAVSLMNGRDGIVVSFILVVLARKHCYLYNCPSSSPLHIPPYPLFQPASLHLFFSFVFSRFTVVFECLFTAFSPPCSHVCHVHIMPCNLHYSRIQSRERSWLFPRANTGRTQSSTVNETRLLTTIETEAFDRTQTVCD